VNFSLDLVKSRFQISDCKNRNSQLLPLGTRSHQLVEAPHRTPPKSIAFLTVDLTISPRHHCCIAHLQSLDQTLNLRPRPHYLCTYLSLSRSRSKSGHRIAHLKAWTSQRSLLQVWQDSVIASSRVFFRIASSQLLLITCDSHLHCAIASVKCTLKSWRKVLTSPLISPLCPSESSVLFIKCDSI
jgi:hypothetical protein